VIVAILAVAGVGVYYGLPSLLRTGEDQPPLNTVVIDGDLATSGQPSAAQLRRLKAQGYAAVINLAPPDSYGAVRDEPRIVADAGMRYVNIPVDFDRPNAGDFDRFRAALDELRGRKVWVHCQMNMRASVFVMLRRVVDDGVPIDRAVQAVHSVWVPNAVWDGWIRGTLARYRVVFDPDLLR
jgi:protein tyrosine phosphatase (PTP) superfamily phosphohydrolase (DUF442 family)